MVRNWASNLPGWVAVEETINVISPGLERLQFGERAAIPLAEALNADIVLIDEKIARLAARNRGLRVTGVLGILGEASTRGLVDLMQAIDRLRQTTFRCSPALFKATLDRFAAKHE